jgi:hypothetical protein
VRYSNRATRKANSSVTTHERTADIHFVVGADGSITKPADPSRDDYIKYEYQLKFLQGFDYKGKLQPTKDDGEKMVW